MRQSDTKGVYVSNDVRTLCHLSQRNVKMTNPILYEQHMHTPLCRHARGKPGEYAAVAEHVGLKGIVVTCHNPLPDGLCAASRMDPEDFPAYVDLVREARATWAGRIDIRLGLECDFMPGLESWLERQINAADLHHVLGSIHPHTREYRERFWRGSPVAFFKQYYEHLAEAAETGLFDTLSHPDIIKNMYIDDWNPDMLMDEILTCLDRVAKTGIAMELNTSGLDKKLPEMNPGRKILEKIHERGIPIVIGADAHIPERVGDDFPEAIDLLDDIGFKTVSIFLDRTRHDIPIDLARTSLTDATSSSDESNEDEGPTQ